MAEIVTKEQYKNTKLGILPSDWEVCTLEELISIQSGNSPKKYEFSKSGKYPYIKVEDMNNCLRYQFESRFYTENKNNLVKKGSILFPKRGAAILNNKIRIAGCELHMDSNMMALTVISPKIDSHFLFELIIKAKLLKIADTSTIPQINNKHINPYKIPLPPLKEQKKIAEILSQWDEAIETTQNLIEKLKLRKKGLMQELLSGKKRLPGLSEEWKKMTIGDVATQFTDKNKDDENIEVLSCTKYDGLVPSLEYFGRKVYGDDLSKYKIVPKSYFAYATNHIEEGSIGFQNIWDRGLVSPMYTVFKTDNTIDDSFFFRLLKTDRMIYSYQSNMSGSIARRGGLRWNVFETLIIKIPSYKEQVAIAEFFDKVDEEIKISSKHLKRLKKQKKGLMQQLLTGQKRVII